METRPSSGGVGGGGGGLEDGIAMIFSPSHLLCTIKRQMVGGGGGHGPPHSYATANSPS